MIKQDTLRPLDIAVVLGLVAGGDSSTATFSELAARLNLSQSTVHQSVQRLLHAGLLRPGSRHPNRAALREFLHHGVRFAFPPVRGRETRGVPTAHSAPALQDLFDASDAMVWPDPEGTVHGTSLAPLYPGATSLPELAPEVYRLLTLVDAIRVGRARERSAAIARLDQALGGEATTRSAGA